MKFYVASSICNAQAVRSTILELEEEYKWTCTYDWTVHGSAIEMDDVKSGRKKFADVAREMSAKEIIGVRTAKVVIVLLPGGRGTHVELGAAIAFNIDHIFVVYENEQDLSGPDYLSVFYWHQLVTRLCKATLDSFTSPADAIARMVVA